VIGGILLVNYAPGAAALDPGAVRRGLVEATLSVLAMAAGVVMAKPLLEQYDFLWIVTLRIVGGVLGMLIVMPSARDFARMRAALAGVRHWPHVIAGSVVGTYISMLLWLAGYKYTQASVAAVLNEMAAIFILALAALFLGDRLRPAQLAGSAVAVAGVLLVVL
jgi:drug/metabolite transporter (DMT)-like permease